MPVKRALSVLILAAAMIPLAGCSGLMVTTNSIAEATHQSSRMSSDSTRSDDAALDAHSATRFVDTDIDAIRTEAARGYGDEVQTLAVLMHEPHPARFGRWMQRHYQALFVGLARPTDLLRRIRHLRAGREA